jgi:uncharacterized protein YwqG
LSELLKLFSDFGLGRVAEPLAGSARDSIRLAATEPGKDAIARLGGRPNLAAGVDWPIFDGKPLAFIAQLDLGALPRVKALDLPVGGSLFFFYDGEGNPKTPADRGMFRVLYSEAPLAACRARSFPKDLPRELRWRGTHFVVARKELSFPELEDTVIERLDFSRHECNRYGAFMDQWLQASGEPWSLHRIGGYPNYLQHDPKFEALLKSRDLWAGIWEKQSETEDYFMETNRRFGELARRWKHEAAEWELLLQVDTDRRFPMPWGDQARLYFLIRKDDLGARRFEKAWMSWDCY